ncbi:unannotated protein [freshwater metagenome]|uniref:Unannotated protein n=1 Tax=freshwater metagenome TaxID=449393 RepID=A0A6J6FKV3_9ZZZZ
MTCPTGVHAIAVSTVVRPVTQSAETEVKTASSAEMSTAPLCDTGMKRITVPTSAALNMLRTIRSPGLMCG